LSESIACILLFVIKEIIYFLILWFDFTLSYSAKIPIFIEPSVVDQCRGERLSVGSIY